MVSHNEIQINKGMKVEESKEENWYDTMEIYSDLENITSKSVIYNILRLLWKTLNPWNSLEESVAMDNKYNDANLNDPFEKVSLEDHKSVNNKHDDESSDKNHN